MGRGSAGQVNPQADGRQVVTDRAPAVVGDRTGPVRGNPARKLHLSGACQVGSCRHQ